MAKRPNAKAGEKSKETPASEIAPEEKVLSVEDELVDSGSGEKLRAKSQGKGASASISQKRKHVLMALVILAVVVALGLVTVFALGLLIPINLDLKYQIPGLSVTAVGGCGLFILLFRMYLSGFGRILELLIGLFSVALCVCTITIAKRGRADYVEAHTREQETARDIARIKEAAANEVTLVSSRFEERDREVEAKLDVLKASMADSNVQKVIGQLKENDSLTRAKVRLCAELLRRGQWETNNPRVREDLSRALATNSVEEFRSMAQRFGVSPYNLFID
jgi:hypothetical protein